MNKAGRENGSFLKHLMTIGAPLSQLYQTFSRGTGHARTGGIVNKLIALAKTAKYAPSLPGPRTIRLEASSRCQLRCPTCQTGTGINKTSAVGWGHLRFEDFSKLIDGNPQVRNVELSNWGEMFLNPDLRRIMEHAQKRGVKLYARNGVNLNSVGEEMLEALVKYGFRELLVSLDGASADSYSRFRRGGNFERVIRNIERINGFKREYRSHYPKLTWQFIVFGHNEHEIAKARDMARSLGMRFVTRINHTPSFSPVRDEARVRRETGMGKDQRLDESYSRSHIKPCAQLWLAPQINWDGEMLGCCINTKDSFGNVFRNGLRKTLHSGKMRQAKRMLTGEIGPREGLPCSTCAFYTGHWDTEPVSKPLELRLPEGGS